jgi:hypothetical protein
MQARAGSAGTGPATQLHTCRRAGDGVCVQRSIFLKLTGIMRRALFYALK